jgi:Flp pilus assembly protein TadG
MAACLGPAAARARAGRARGQALMDFALVVLLLLTLALLVFAGGLLAANWFALGNAAREGAHAGSLAIATDAAILDAVNRTASSFTGSFASVTANTAPDDCTGAHAVCVCRRRVGATSCGSGAARGDLIAVTVRHRVEFAPFAGGFLGQNAGIQLTAHEQARIE